jgi:hypothetical protein
MRADPLLWVIFSLREDYVASLEPFARRLPGKLRTRFYMRRLGHKVALEAIERPAEKGGRPFTPGVAQILVDNLRQIRLHGRETEIHLGEFVEPVQLQVVCYQLWENLKERPPGEITEQDLQELGDVDTALAEFYEKALVKTLGQTDISEIELRRWFDQQLITEAGTRGVAYQGAYETAGLPNPAVTALANQFLLRAEIRAGGTWYELVHDRFVEPIIKANQAWWLRQNPLIRAAQAWEDSGRDEGKLYLGQQLKDALVSIGQSEPEPLVAEFLAASEAENQILVEQMRIAKRLSQLSSWLVVVFGAMSCSWLGLFALVAVSNSQGPGVVIVFILIICFLAAFGAILGWLGLRGFRRLTRSSTEKSFPGR